jgi:F-type H+-transporting ATPase subunit b
MPVTVFALQTAGGGGQIEQIAATFGVNWPHLIAQIISFSIVCALLYWLAYRPILQMLSARRRQIADGLANAEKIRAELAKTESQRQEVLTTAHKQAESIVEQARADAARVEAMETRRAKAAAEDILSKAREAALLEHDRMLADLRREVGRLVVHTTASVTHKVLTAEDHRRLAEETASQLTA